MAQASCLSHLYKLNAQQLIFCGVFGSCYLSESGCLVTERSRSTGFEDLQDVLIYQNQSTRESPETLENSLTL